MQPFLILDCYLSEAPGAPNLVRYLPGIPTVALRMRDEPHPIDPDGFRGILVTGSAASVLAPPPWLATACDILRRAAERDIPVLGICFGHQLLAHTLLGPHTVFRRPRPEVGFVPVRRMHSDPLLSSLPSDPVAFMTHEDEVREDLPDLDVLARTAECPTAAFRVRGTRAWGIQFHVEMQLPEMTDIVQWRARRHPGLELDPADILQNARSTDSVAHPLFARFVDLVSST